MKKLHVIPSARKGFTLLEALFAVLIIAILAAAAIPMYNNTRKESERKTCSNNVQAILNAQSKYRFENEVFTPTLSNLINHGLAEEPQCPEGPTAYDLTGTSDDTCTVTCGNTGHTTKTITAP